MRSLQLRPTQSEKLMHEDSPQRQPKRLLIMDGTAMLFRAFYGIGSILSRHGDEIGGVFGVAQLLQDLIARHKPAHAAIVFDTNRNTFRREIDPNYKANRKPPPPPLPPQIPKVRSLIEALGFATFSIEGFEADDLMATLAAEARKSDMATLLVSNDKDLCQLVCDKYPPTRLYDPYRSQYFDEDGVCTRMGIPPKLAIDYQALVGDSTDNVPGVPGVGPKSALSLLRELGNLDQIYERLEEVCDLPVRGANRLQVKLEQGRDKAYLSKQLVTLKPDVPIAELTSTSLHQLTCWEGPTDTAEGVLDTLGFSLSIDWFRRISQRIQRAAQPQETTQQLSLQSQRATPAQTAEAAGAC